MARLGPTMNLNLLQGRLQSNMGLMVGRSVGESPFVFDSYYGGSQNFNMTNMFRVNKFLSLGTTSSFSLKRDNAKGALAVGNSLLMMVGPTDVKATLGYDFITRRSFFGVNYYPKNNTVVDFEQGHIIQPKVTDYRKARPGKPDPAEESTSQPRAEADVPTEVSPAIQ